MMVPLSFCFSQVSLVVLALLPVLTSDFVHRGEVV